MTALVVRSSFGTSIARYARSRRLWLLLLAGPVGARFMVARDDGSGVQIAMGRHLPVMTSAVLGVSLGIVVSTLLLPIGFLYLRSNVTRRQPWQIEEVAPASRVSIALGRFGADVAVLLAMLLTLTLAGAFLGWLIVSGPLDVVQVSWTLWLIAAPALVGLAVVHRLLDARPSTRGGLGDLVFFMLWMTSIAMPAAVQHRSSSLATNLADFPGFVRPLTGPVTQAGQDFAIGSSDVLPGRVPLDVMAGIGAPGYVASRLMWVIIAVALTIFSGLLYRPHGQPRRRRWGHAIARLLSPGAPPAAQSNAPPARIASPAFIWLLVGEFRLIGAGRLFKLFAVAAACAGLAGDYRHVGSPAAMLLLVFALVAHAGRSEAKGLLALTRTARLAPSVHRVAFVVAGAVWAILLAAPAAIVRMSLDPIVVTALVGTIAALVAMTLATLSHSAFAARLVLLVLWYAFLSS